MGVTIASRAGSAPTATSALGYGQGVLVRIAATRERLRGSLWFVPALLVSAVSMLAVVTLRLDRTAETTGTFGFTGSPDAASTMLATIAGAIVTLTALVFSVTVVALQLASSQYSPRVLRSFLRDRTSKVVLGMFLATFAYTMLVLRAVRSEDAGDIGFVPAISVHAAFGMAALSLALFVVYVNHTAQSMQASVIVARVADQTREALERLHPRTGHGTSHPEDPWRPPDAPATTVRWRGPAGYVQTVDERALLRHARDRDATYRLQMTTGEFVAPGAVVLAAWPDGSDDGSLSELVVKAVAVGSERTLQQDAAFGFRQLVDIAERALSPSLNDPTTAVQALDRLGQLMLLLADRDIPAPARRDDDGVVRVVLPRPGWDDYVHLAFDEIRHHSEGSLQVSARLHAVLTALADAVPDERRPAIEDQLGLVRRAMERSIPDDEDRRWRTSGTALLSRDGDR